MGTNHSLPEFDLAGLVGILRVCDLDLVLLDGHAPRVGVKTVVCEGALFCSIHSGSRFRGRFVLPPDWCLLGFFHDAGDDGSWCHGAILQNAMAVAALPEGAAEFALGAGSRMTLVMLPYRLLQGAYDQLSLAGARQQSTQFAPFLVEGNQWGAHLADRYAAISQLLDSDGKGLDAVLADLVEAHVQAALSARSVDRPLCPRGQRIHYHTLQRAEAYMRLNLRRDIYLEELCQAVGVSERALRYAFKNMLGLSPNRYLSMMRLCTACLELSSADSERRSVKAVAMSCGLWDLSRFADNYRKVFGELPSDTLQRAPVHYFGSQ